MRKDYKQPDLHTSTVGCAARLPREFFFLRMSCVCAQAVDSEAEEKWTVTAEDVAEKS